MIKYDKDNFDPNNLDDNDIDKIQIKMIPDNSTVLEIGCATGFMSEYLKKEKKCFVYGIEYNESQAKLAKKKCDLLLCGGIDDAKIQGNLDRYVKEKQKFDVIFMSQVIEHIAYPDKALIKLKDWLSNDGALIISTVIVTHWKSRLRLLFGKWEYEEYGLFDNTHLRFFNVNGFEKMLINAGYEIVDAGYNIDDFTPFYKVPKIRGITIYNLCRKLGILDSKLFLWYNRKFRNFITAIP